MKTKPNTTETDDIPESPKVHYYADSGCLLLAVVAALLTSLLAAYAL